MKKYVEIDEVIKDTDVPQKLWQFQKEMQEIPNFDKAKHDDSKRVIEKGQYIVLKVSSRNRVGYVLYNKDKKWEIGHTHLKSINMAKTIIANIENKKKPKTNNIYLLESHMRVSNDAKYNEFIQNLINTKIDKGRKEYINRR